MVKITINDDCIDCKACISIASHVFEIENFVIKAISDDCDAALEAAKFCPVSAIEIEIND